MLNIGSPTMYEYVSGTSVEGEIVAVVQSTSNTRIVNDDCTPSKMPPATVIVYYVGEASRTDVEVSST